MPGGGWVRSGRSSQQPDQPLVGQLGQPGAQRHARWSACELIADQRKAAARPRQLGVRPATMWSVADKNEEALRRQRLARRPTRRDHAVSELAADRTGALSPFGDMTFPLPAEELPYIAPGHRHQQVAVTAVPDRLSHLDESGAAHMVDVTAKDATKRIAVAAGTCTPAPTSSR